MPVPLYSADHYVLWSNYFSRMTYASTLIRPPLALSTTQSTVSGEGTQRSATGRPFMLAADTHASHYIHMQVCTLTDAALPCKMLFGKLTTAIIYCVPIQCPAHTSINTGKHPHANRSMDSDNNSCLSLSIRGNRPFFSFFSFFFAHYKL